MWKNGFLQHSIDKPFEFYSSFHNGIPQEGENVFLNITAKLMNKIDQAGRQNK